MARYIDADWLVQKIDGWRKRLAETYGEDDEYVCFLDEVLMRIDDAPTADVVEVVRCKDCKHGRSYKHTKEYVACEVDCEPIDRDSDFFCADGKRRE